MEVNIIGYDRLSAFIENIVYKAKSEGIVITSVNELHAYLDNNPDDDIKIIEW